jgi:acyl carrier protein
METLSSDIIEQKLKEIIANELDVNMDIDEIDSEISLYEDGVGLDSISIVNLIVQIEEKFQIEFLEADMNSGTFSSISALAKYIQAKSNGK